MQAKVRKAKAKSTKQSTAKATIRKLPKGSGIVVPVDQRRGGTHTIHLHGRAGDPHRAGQDEDEDLLARRAGERPGRRPRLSVARAAA